MKLQRVKTDSEIPVGERLTKGELRTVDGSVKGVTLTFESGKVLQASVENYSEFHLLVPETPKLVARHQVSAKLFGVDLTKTFSSKYEASKYRDKLNEIENVSAVSDVTEVQLSSEEPVAESINDEFPF